MTATASYKAESGGGTEERPFKPLFTIRRSGRIEVTVYGMVHVIDGEGKTIMATGDTAFELWSRSLLKPWQLLTNYQILRDNYPALTDAHFALFMASHSGEALHLQALEEILAITGVDEAMLKCPPATPVDHDTKELMRERGEKPRRRYHNCSGKHSGYLAAVKANVGEEKMPDYLRESEDHNARLKHILSSLSGRDESTFSATTDGCQLPNYALSVSEMSYFYMTLLNKETLPERVSGDKLFAPYENLGRLMLKNPRLVSGKGRLDYKIMSGEIFADAPAMVAKEGADGLLGIGIEACDQYPHGLGAAIKLSAGFDTHHMELISREILTALGLTERIKSTDSPVKTDHIKTEFHFLSNLTR